MDKAMTGSSLQREAEETRYTLRSSFFYRIPSLWLNLVEMAQLARQLSPDWKIRQRLGISRLAWDRVQNKHLDPILVFCHPDVIKATPTLIAYYRCLALLPQKGAQRLAFSVQRYEEGTKLILADGQATKLASVLNGLISLLIESDPAWSLEKAHIAALLNLGTQVNGSWRNEIGAEGSKRVKELLVSHFTESQLVAKVVDAAGSELSPGLIGTAKGVSVASIRSFITSNNYIFLFGSEPDVSIQNPAGVLVSTIEVKYGLDPAGALERYGAAKKSFEQATRQNRRVHNIYLASCITPEVRNRINEDRLVNEDFNLTEVLSSSEKRDEFLSRLRHIVNL